MGLLNRDQWGRNKVMTKVVLDIVGGSGIYDLPGLENAHRPSPSAAPG